MWGFKETTNLCFHWTSPEPDKFAQHECSHRQREDQILAICACGWVTQWTQCKCVSFFFCERTFAFAWFRIYACLCVHSNCHQLLFQFEVCRIWMKLNFIFIIFRWWLSSSVCPHRNSFPSGRCLCLCVFVNLICLLQAWLSAIISPFYCLGI